MLNYAYKVHVLPSYECLGNWKNIKIIKKLFIGFAHAQYLVLKPIIFNFFVFFLKFCTYLNFQLLSFYICTYYLIGFFIHSVAVS